MNQLPTVEPATAQGRARELLDAVQQKHGDLADGELHRAAAAGVSDAEIAETVGLVALNILTNYFNKAAGVENDWPLVRAHGRAA